MKQRKKKLPISSHEGVRVFMYDEKDDFIMHTLMFLCVAVIGAFVVGVVLCMCWAIFFTLFS